jgi:hypothetical protein
MKNGFSQNATAATEFDGLGGPLANLYAKSILRNERLTDADVKDAKTNLGVSQGWLSFLSAPEAIGRLKTARELFVKSLNEAQNRRPEWEKNAPQSSKQVTSVEKILQDIGKQPGNTPVVTPEQMPNSPAVKAMNGDLPTGEGEAALPKTLYPEPKAKKPQAPKETVVSKLNHMTREQKRKRLEALRKKEQRAKRLQELLEKQRKAS